jgi:hypothetical protein
MNKEMIIIYVVVEGGLIQGGVPSRRELLYYSCPRNHSFVETKGTYEHS